MTEVRIDLPLPGDIVSTLIQVIGITYPNTVIKTDDRPDWDKRHQLVLEIDEADRHKTPKKRKKYEEAKQHASVKQVDITELTPNSVGVSPWEWLAKSWVAMAKDGMEMFGADNYLETTLMDPEINQRYVFWVAKSKEQTPHALRQKAEQRIAVLEAEIAQLKGDQP